jgi:hypothetical protein
MVFSAAAADWLGMTRQPWLDYNGESIEQLLDYARTRAKAAAIRV